MDYFDLSKQFKGGLEAFKIKNKILNYIFFIDWLYTTKDNKDIVIVNASEQMCLIPKLLQIKARFFTNEPQFLKTLKGFIDSLYEKFKNEKEFK